MTMMSNLVDLHVIGAPFQHGQKKSGVELSPIRMREAGIVKQLHRRGVRITDLVDIEFDEFLDDTLYCNIYKPRAVGSANRKISKAVSESLRDGGDDRCCLLLGGDHSVAIGSIHGHAAADTDVAVIWVDAHADINPPASSLSGNAHGMPLAFVINELRHAVPGDLPEFNWLRPCLRADSIAYIGLRDVDDAERRILDELNIAAFFMDDVRQLGIASVVSEAIKAVSRGSNRPIHLSFDIDAMDSTVAPSTGTCVSGGLTLTEGVYIAKAVADTGRLRVVDLVEVNTSLGSASDRQKTLNAANAVVAGCFNRTKRGITTP